ncbi:MAG: DUF4440 domain-containing protein [Rhodobiaceae bacterium]|nr:MAG: DUF4440 domain-containing protein [Rhodobiaceae bacterium]
MREIETLLFANEAFYRAVSDRDLDMLDALWSVTAPASCLHPGWPPLHGRKDVMESWLRIIRGPSPPVIECVATTAHLIDTQVGLVTCYERIGEEWFIATNFFVREGTGWSLFHHQSGPTGAPPEADEDEAPRQMN